MKNRHDCCPAIPPTFADPTQPVARSTRHPSHSIRHSAPAAPHSPTNPTVQPQAHQRAGRQPLLFDRCDQRLMILPQHPHLASRSARFVQSDHCDRFPTEQLKNHCAPCPMEQNFRLDQNPMAARRHRVPHSKQNSMAHLPAQNRMNRHRWPLRQHSPHPPVSPLHRRQPTCHPIVAHRHQKHRNHHPPPHLNEHSNQPSIADRLIPNAATQSHSATAESKSPHRHRGPHQPEPKRHRARHLIRKPPKMHSSQVHPMQKPRRRLPPALMCLPPTSSVRLPSHSAALMPNRPPMEPRCRPCPRHCANALD